MRRTRVLSTKQSKLGCYTCKKRRIKCDETHPACLRCQRSQVLCAGYPPGALSGGESACTAPSSSSRSLPRTFRSSDLPIDRFSLMPGCTDEQVQLCQLACTVLGADPHQIYCPSNAAVFGYLLPQLTLSVPFVAIAAAAFGAAYESTLLHENSLEAAKASTSQYINALRLLQAELQNPNGDYTPLVIASVLLAAAEIVQHREEDALSHVIGAFALHTLRDKDTAVENGQSRCGGSKIGSEGATDVLLEDLFRSIDVQISTFIWWKQPLFGLKQLVARLPTRITIKELIYDQPALLHSCLHFLSKVLQECSDNDGLASNLVYEQEHLISMLQTWLANCDELLKRESKLEKSLSNAGQMSYDKYEKQFGQMLKSAELVLGPEQD
ncbi:hypothetical protein DV735_g5865, partial [Chaetothyriales sp. CBS 134920]